CYFSVFFAPFLFPIVVYFVVGLEVKRHAKKALWSHFITLVVIFAGVITTVILGINGWAHFDVFLIVIYALYDNFVLLVLFYYYFNICLICIFRFSCYDLEYC